jgi:hypothetical protein
MNIGTLFYKPFSNEYIKIMKENIWNLDLNIQSFVMEPNVLYIKEVWGFNWWKNPNKEKKKNSKHH